MGRRNLTVDGKRPCKRCGDIKDISRFSRYKASSGDIYTRSYCRPCESKTTRDWQKRTGYRPVKIIVDSQNRRAALADAAGDFTVVEWRDRLAEFNGRCAYCLKPNTKLEVEHMFPISRGGNNDISNIVPACSSCNRSKGPKTLLEYIHWAA